MSRPRLFYHVVAACLVVISCNETSVTVEEEVPGATTVEEEVLGAATAELAARRFYEALLAGDLEAARLLVPNSTTCADTDFESYCLEEAQGMRTLLLREILTIGQRSHSEVGELTPLEPEPSWLAFSLALSGQPIEGFDRSDWEVVQMFQPTNHTLHALPVATIEINGHYFCFYVFPRHE